MHLRQLAIAAILVLPLPTAAENPVAVVARYLPPKAEPVVTRTGGEEVVAGLGTPLYVGDTVTLADGGSLDIAYADGARESLAGPTEFTVPEKEEMGLAARVYDRLQNMLGRKYRQGSNLATRNPGHCGSSTPPLDAPVLSPTTFLLRGHENVALAWTGGCAPYTLEVSGPLDTPLQMTDLKRPLTRLDAQQLATGRYSLTIKDSRKREVAVELIVIDTLPDGPVASSGIDSELDAVAYTAWLANYDNGNWRLESFQQLRPWIRKGGAMAGTYGDLVMWGDPHLDPDATD